MNQPYTRAWSNLLRLVQQWAVITAVIAVAIGGAAAQAPGRTITIVVPVTLASGPDILVRTIGEGFSGAGTRRSSSRTSRAQASRSGRSS